MLSKILLLFLTFLFGVGATASYTPPQATKNHENSAVYEAKFDETWNQLVFHASRPSLDFAEEEESPVFKEHIPSYSEADEAAAQVDLVGNEFGLSVTPVTEATISEEVQKGREQGVTPEEAAWKIEQRNERHLYYKELSDVAGDLASTPEVVRLLKDDSINAGAAVLNATSAVATSIIDTELQRLQKEDGEDSIVKNVGEFLYEEFLVFGVDVVGRKAAQQFTDDEVTDNAIVNEFLRKSAEEGPAPAINYLRENLEDAGKDLFGYQRQSRLHRIKDGINHFGTTPGEGFMAIINLAILGVGSAAVIRILLRRFSQSKLREADLSKDFCDEEKDIIANAITQPCSREKDLTEMTSSERFDYKEQKQAEEYARIDAKLRAKARHETSDQRKSETDKRHKSLKQTEDDWWYPSVSGKTMALARLVVRSFLRKIADEEKRRLLAVLLIELNEEEFTLQDAGGRDEEMFELLVSNRVLEILERWREQVISEMRNKSGEEMLQAQSFVALVTTMFVDEMERRGLAPD